MLQNARCFKDAVIELDPQLTVLIGENGAGKTTVVEALASLTYGKEEGLSSFPLSREATKGEIALYESPTTSRPVARWRSGATETSARRLPSDRYLLAYGRYRRVFFPGEATTATSSASPAQDLGQLASRASGSRTATLFRPDNHLLRDLSRYLVALHVASQSDPRLASVWQRLENSLQQLGQDIEGIEMIRGKTGYIPRVKRNGVSLELSELSDGYQAVLVIVFDLILRYIYLFASLEDPLLGSAMVAIDEVELHLHPRWQRTVTLQLTTLFPQTQFVLTTHSPAVVQGAIDQERRIVCLRDDGGRATAMTLAPRETKQLVGAEIGSLLLEERLFGVDSRYSPRFSKVEERVSDMQEKVASGEASKQDVKGLFRDLGTLQKLVAADEVRRADGPFLSQLAELRGAFLKDLATQIEKARGET